MKSMSDEISELIESAEDRFADVVTSFWSDMADLIMKENQRCVRIAKDYSCPGGQKRSVNVVRNEIANLMDRTEAQ